ncbi:MAG TPA: 30S ribosomal protein S1 [Candidatus Acidoferrales bacterium]|nr:30S ribosomal protein S1 [Candidatus Acidoferrales bacterium]
MPGEHEHPETEISAANAATAEPPAAAAANDQPAPEQASITGVDTGSNGSQEELPASTISVENSAEQISGQNPAVSSEAPAADAPASEEPMEQLIEQFAVPQSAAPESEILEGRVVAVSEIGVVIDVGAKFEGLIPAQEFMETGGIPFQPGDTIEVERLDEKKEGYVVLSHLRAQRRRLWEKIEKSHRDGLTLTGKIADRIKGGLVVDIGVRAFMPASQLDLKPTHDLDSWKDREIECRVLKVNRKRGNVVVSRRAILEEEQRKQREAVAASVTEGSVVTGKVKNITEYGVFVDLGGLDGLLHISDLVWGRIKHPSEAVSVGQDIEVQVLKFDKEKMRISLGRKQLLPDPWATVPERFPAGTRLRGQVVGVADYGAFVQIEPGVEGLVHVSEMSWSKRLVHPSKVVKNGDEIEVVVLDLKPEQRRISLGLKQTMADPWAAVAEKYAAGSVVSGRVRNLVEFGAFVELEEGIEGLIHVSDFSWTERVKNPGDKFKKGDMVQAKVLKIDSEHRRLSLGIKQLNDIWGNWFAEHKLNDVVKGKVTRNATFGAFVGLAEGIEGLCHISEIEDRKSKKENGERQPKGTKARTTLTPGQEYDFKVIKLDPESRKISLSYRAAKKQEERKEMEAFHEAKASAKSSPTATIGDAILAKRQAS